MQLTKGQKDALVRKAMDIVYEKKHKREDDLKAKWKPTKSQEKALSEFKRIIELRNAYLNAVNNLGFEFGYCEVRKKIGDCSLSISRDSENTDYEKVVDALREYDVSKQLCDEFDALPNQTSITDEVELLSLSKDFDLDAFLEKYRKL